MWEKTVMNIKQVRKFYDGAELKPLLEAQAELTGDIAYKAGEAQAYKKWEPAQFQAEQVIRQGTTMEYKISLDGKINNGGSK